MDNKILRKQLKPLSKNNVIKAVCNSQEEIKQYRDLLIISLIELRVTDFYNKLFDLLPKEIIKHVDNKIFIEKRLKRPMSKLLLVLSGILLSAFIYTLTLIIIEVTK